MPKIIYVPQGHSARLTADTQISAVQGLYTDRFSTCNLIVCMGTNGVTLIHADMNTSPAWVEKEIKDVGQPNTVMLYYRPNDGEPVKANILSHLAAKLPSLRVTPQEVDISNDGILVPFQARSISDIQVLPLGQRPNELIHHPKEEQLLTIQKIGQIIGVRARDRTMRANRGIPIWQDKQFCLFDGLAWEHVDESKLQVDTSHGLTREEMNWFKPQEPSVLIGSKLGSIVQKASQEGMPLANNGAKDLAVAVMPYMANYINNYDHILIFRLDMKDIVNQKYVRPETEKDTQLQKDLNKILDQKHENPNDLKRLIDECIGKYKGQLPHTTYMKQMFEEHKSYSGQYEEREFYRSLAKRNGELKKIAKEESQKGTKYFQEQDYYNAATCHSKALQIYSYCCIKNETILLHAYYNYGMSLHKLGQTVEAAPFFRRIILLKEQNPSIAPQLTGILIGQIKEILSTTQQHAASSTNEGNEQDSPKLADTQMLAAAAAGSPPLSSFIPITAAMASASITGISTTIASTVSPLLMASHQSQSALSSGMGSATQIVAPTVSVSAIPTTPSHAQQVLSMDKGVDANQK